MRVVSVRLVAIDRNVELLLVPAAGDVYSGNIVNDACAPIFVEIDRK